MIAANMRRTLRTLLFLVLVAAALMALEWARERNRSRFADLRSFDAPVVAKLDAQMWRSRYEHRNVELFRQMVTLLRTQYHLPPVMAAIDAYHAAHAAIVFKGGHNRADYAKALPDLQDYYADISRASTQPFDSRETAQLELAWWIVHREQSGELDAALAALESAIYHVPAFQFSEHAQLRAEAMIFRDSKGDRITDDDWRKIGALLDRSWLSLYAAVNGAVLAENRP